MVEEDGSTEVYQNSGQVKETTYGSADIPGENRLSVKNAMICCVCVGNKYVTPLDRRLTN